MKTKRKPIVIIPAYNEEKLIGRVLRRLKTQAVEIVVVDDGSKDNTGKVAKEFGVTVLQHRINLGKGAAMKTGIEFAIRLKPDFVIFMDGDGQHDSKYIPEFCKKIEQGFDIVFGARKLSDKVPFVRFFGNRVGAFIINLLFHIYRSDLLCGYIALTPDAYKKIKWDSSRYGVETEIVARTGKNKLKYEEVSMEAIYNDKYKGVTIMDAIGILFNIPRWKFLN